MNKKYYIGIDIGTASCGVACCDENYNVLKVNNKHCLTSRIFDKAESCAARRLKRGQRRILERRAKRIHLLNEIFQDEIKERDPLFLERLKNSQLYLTDKEKENNGGNKEEKYKIYTLGKYTLFNDKDFNDKKFHKMFPTIYHLRKCLIDEKDVNHKFAISDIRLVYLACHHILKKRGNFLYEDMSEKDIENINIETEFNKLNEKIQEIDEDNDLFKRIDHKMIKYFCDQILNTKKTTNEFLNNFMQEFGLKKNDKEVFFLNIILNKKITKTDSKALFSETEKGKEIYFNNKYDSKIEDYTDNSDFRSIIDILYHISLKIFWKKIIKEKYISEVFIKEYQNHNNTRHRILSYLKEKNRQEDINLLFKGEEEGKNLYGHFVGKYLKDNKQERLDKKGIKVGENYEDPHDSLINGIKKVFKTDDQNANFTPPQSLKDIFYDGWDSSTSFFLAPLSYINAQLNAPFQYNLLELKKIIENASVHHSFLNIKDEVNLSPSDKIISILEFRMPYYVGITSKKGFINITNEVNRKPWIERTNEKILPWNYKNVIDLSKTARNFIEKMIGRCRYLQNEYVLPKKSILYSKYEVLNLINKIKIKKYLDENSKTDFQNITLEERNEIYKLYENGKNVGKKKIHDCLKKFHNDLTIKDISVGNNTDEQIDKTNLSAIGSLLPLFNDNISELNANINICEEIIKNVTILEDKSILTKTIIEQYERFNNEDSIKIIENLSFSGWGRISKKMLELKVTHSKNGVAKKIIEWMETGYEKPDGKIELVNFMEILEKKSWSDNVPYFSTMDEIEKFNKNIIKPITNVHDFFEEKGLWIPSFIKRSFNECIKVIDEYVKLIGCRPEKIFIETTRFVDRDKKIKDTRHKQLKEDLSKFRALPEYGQLSAEINREDVIKKIKDESVYLYFRQLGKDLYTGKPIDLNDLISNNDKYEVDHIIPQSMRKNDSLENKVLTAKWFNIQKANTYPFVHLINEEVRDMWKSFNKSRAMSDMKFKILSRHTPLANDEIMDFINRDLVQTGWEVEILKQYFSLNEKYKNINIVSNKPKNCSMLRELLEIPKYRYLDNMHHAIDAYLNIVSGNTIYEKFGKFFFNKRKTEFNWDNVKNKDTLMKKIYADIDIEKIKKQADKNNVSISKHVYFNTQDFYKETIKPKPRDEGKQRKDIIATKNKLNGIKYGGYAGYKSSTFACIKLDKEIKLWEIPDIELVKFGNKLPTMNQYNKLCDLIKKIFIKYNPRAQNIKIIHPLIPQGSKINYDGQDIYIHGNNGTSLYVSNAQNFIFDEESYKNLFKYLFSKETISKGNVTDKILEEANKILMNLKDQIITLKYIHVKRNFPQQVNEELQIIKELFKYIQLDKKTFGCGLARPVIKKELNGIKTYLFIDSPTGLSRKKYILSK